VATYFTGPGAWLDWLAVIRHSAAEAGRLGIVPDRMYNLKCVFYGLLGAERMPLVNALTFAALAVGAVAIALLWWGPWPVASRAYRARMALSLQLGLLTCPHLNPADAAVYALPAVLVAAGWPAVWLFVVLTLCPALFAVDYYTLIDWPFGLRPFIVAMAAVAAAQGEALRRA
jgi:hypothetical protein